MSTTFKAPLALGAALVLICSVGQAHIAPPAANTLTPQPQRFLQAGAHQPGVKGLDADARAQLREQARYRKMQEALAARKAAMNMIVLYSAVPGAVLSLSDSLLETAMGPGLRLGEPVDKAIWMRMNRTDKNQVLGTTMRSGMGQLSSKSQLDERLFSAQVGAPVYTSERTRIDATLGFGGSRLSVSQGKKSPELKAYSGTVGAILEYRAPAGIDLRVGTQLMGGSSELNAPGQGKKHTDFKQKFKHYGAGLRAEAGRDFAISSHLVATPLVGVGANMARVKQSKIKTESHTAVSVWASARLAYLHQMQSGRTTHIWVEPTYINNVKRSTTIGAKMGGESYSVTSRLPGDRMGARLGADVALGKQGSLEVGVSRFWGLGRGKGSESAVTLGYVHRV